MTATNKKKPTDTVAEPLAEVLTAEAEELAPTDEELAAISAEGVDEADFAAEPDLDDLPEDIDAPVAATLSKKELAARLDDVLKNRTEVTIGGVLEAFGDYELSVQDMESS